MVAEPAFALEMKRRLGFQEWTPHQQFALSSFHARKDALVVAPTGSGKTMCYVLPTLSGPGLTVVVEPLISLINDQMQRMQALNIPAVSFDSTQSQEQRREAWEQVKSGNVKILFLAPERLALPKFRERLAQLSFIKLWVVDEAHCISQWGHSFRPEYRQLGTMFQRLPHVPILALTATATRAVQADICQVLHLRDPEIYVSAGQRENISMAIEISRSTQSQKTLCLESVSDTHSAGIVYCPSRRMADEMSSELHAAGVRHGLYHAGLDKFERKRQQNLFMEKKVNIVVATPAFGLGIDRDDIRHIWHYGMPGSLESYVQEIGRAGRDGKDAWSVLFYGPRDFFRQKMLMESALPKLDVVEKAMSWVDQEMTRFAVWPLAKFRRVEWGEGVVDQLIGFLHRTGYIKLVDLYPTDDGIEWDSEGAMRGDATGLQVIEAWNAMASISNDKLRAIHSYVKADPLQRAQMLDDYFMK